MLVGCEFVMCCGGGSGDVDGCSSGWRGGVLFAVCSDNNTVIC
jgi:hypothetical protein